MLSSSAARRLGAACISAVILALSTAAAAAPAHDDAGPDRPRWHRAAQRLADRHSLAAAFRAKGYVPPDGAMALFTAVVHGAQGLGYIHFALDQKVFKNSPGVYWPASAIKPFAAVAAFMALHRAGIDASTPLHFRDVYGTFDGPATTLISPLNNRRFDRLLLIAGLEQLNTWPAKADFGLPYMTITRGYGGKRLGDSPPISAPGHTPALVLADRPFNKSRLSSHCRSNCASLFELQEVLRRVVLAPALSASQRFPMADGDAAALRLSFLEHQPKKLRAAIVDAFGIGAQQFNKSGSLRGRDQIENVVVTGGRQQIETTGGPDTQNRLENVVVAGDTEPQGHQTEAAPPWPALLTGDFLLTVSIRWPRRDRTPLRSLTLLNAFAAEVIEAAMQKLTTQTGPLRWLQDDAGNIGLRHIGRDLWLSGPELTAVRLFVGNAPAVEVSLKHGEGHVRLPADRRPVVVMGLQQQRTVAYRLLP